MASRQFKQTVRTVSRNLERYTSAMETDIQVLINSMLDLIESKIASLRKLLKLKLCIKNVKSFSALRNITSPDDTSVCETRSGNDPIEKKIADSLEDLSSMVYELDKASLPKYSGNLDVKTQQRLKYLEDIAAIESLCAALNKKDVVKTDKTNEKTREALDKYIYLLLDSEKQKDKGELGKQHFGDFERGCALDKIRSSLQSTQNKPAAKKAKSQESGIFLAKSEYESIIDILNSVLASYKENDVCITKMLEKHNTEPSLHQHHEDERKILSDPNQTQKDVGNGEKKLKNRKSFCL